MESKKIISGVLALTMAFALTACGKEATEGTGEANTSESTAETTTAVTVEVNTETLKAEEEEKLATALDKLRDVELENNTIKWLAHYDLNPSSNGASKRVEVEIFEKKYGGVIEYYPTTWATRYTDLSTYILGGEGIDFFPGDDANNFPKGIISGMFQPVDDYIDLSDDIWQNTATAMEIFNFGGKHYEFVTGVTAEQVVMYNKATIEAQGLEDPWELYEAGEWNWDTFKAMLLEYVDEDSDQWGLDNWFNEKALYLSAGVPTVQAVDGRIVCNINDPTVEKAMNYQYDLYNNGLVLPLEQFSWSIQPQKMGEGGELFWLNGMWGVEGKPETWTIQVEPENLGIAPVPSPAGSDPYQSAVITGYALCKGASNPAGVALLAECAIVANTDENAIAIADRKKMDDSQLSEEIIEKSKKIDELARQYPVLDLAGGCSNDIAALTVDGGSTVGTRAAFHGVDWATNREAIADTIIMLVDEVDQELQKAIAS